jgi:hypothetical protein
MQYLANQQAANQATLQASTNGVLIPNGSGGTVTNATVSPGGYPAGTNIGGTNVGPYYPGATLAVSTATATGTGTTTGSSTPGSPNTGAGGDAMVNILLLAVALMVAGAGMLYFVKHAAANQ